MKNPLNKRLPRELKGDIGKYLVIFLFLLMLISLVSGFLVADGSLAKTYREDFSRRNVEDGHFVLDGEADGELLGELEEKGNITVYDLRYFDEEMDGETATVRVYKLSAREVVNIYGVHEGRMPEADDEIAIDRMFADNRGISVGDELTLHARTLKVTALISLPDYSCLFENNSDMMFDAMNFGVAVMTDEGFEAFGSNHIKYSYAWCYPVELEWDDNVTSKKYSDEFLDVFSDVLSDYYKEKVRQALTDEETKSDIFLAMFREYMEEAEEDLSKYNSPLFYGVVADTLTKELSGEEGKSMMAEYFGEGSDQILEGIELEISAQDVDRAFNASDDEVEEANAIITDLMDSLVKPTDYLPRYQNRAITFTGEDMGGDRATIIMFDYLVTIVLAFIFAVTTAGTIAAEAGVIGTLRASGYTKAELLRHYMILPMAVVFVAAVIGNILGYTFFERMMAALYMHSYSLAPYDICLNAEAFILTTVVPIVIMFVINLVMLIDKLRLSPLRFIRHDLSRRGRKKAFRLNTKIPIMIRFRLRVLFQNIPNYIVLFLGIFLGGVLVTFSLMMLPLMESYGEKVLETKICKYQYYTIDNPETSVSGAEKFLATSLKTYDENYKLDEVSVFGIWPESAYVKQEIPEGQVLVNNGLASKFNLHVGDTYKLKDPYSNTYYEFTVGGVYTYDAALSIFMNRDDYLDMFNEPSENFTGYFSDEELTDVADENIYTVITEEDLLKLTTQIKISMGNFMYILEFFGVAMFLLIMYILSKQIIEKNAKSISITKILGYTGQEIGGLYIVATSAVVILSLLVTVPLTDIAMRAIFSGYLYKRMSGYFPFIISPWIYVEMIALGVVSYGVVAMLQMRKINRIPKADALKNVE
ncbi:MAG: FtsX-like permease family protein [Lachnospiraceae bacterium]|nr:FtsX-like permease family protein [Lachnospiraceae bacterium]